MTDKIVNNQPNQNEFLFKLILSVCIVLPLSIDIFISGLPQLSRYFPNENVSLVLSVTLFGLAVSQLIYGPLLDRFGRKPILIIGLWIYTLSSLLVTLTDSFTFLILGRFLQAIGGCSGTVAALALAKDHYKKEDLIYATGLIMAVISISPIIAPLIGSFLNTLWGWRASFAFLVFLGGFYTVLVQIYLQETLINKNQQALHLKNILGNYLKLTKINGFLTYSFSNGFTYSILFSYLALSSFFILEQFNFSMVHYGWIVSTNAFAIFIMAKLAPKLSKKISLFRTVILGFVCIVLGGLLMTFLNFNYDSNIYLFMVPMLITTVGAGIIRPTVIASAMQLAPESIAGSAAALFHFVSFGCGSIASTFCISLIPTVFVFGGFISIMGLSALLLMGVTFYKKRNRNEAIQKI